MARKLSDLSVEKMAGERLNDQNSMFSKFGLGNPDEDFKNIPIEKIYPNKLNEPYMENITEKQIKLLCNNIMKNGMHHNLVVINDMMGKYRLISGEKRWRALMMMTPEQRSKEFPNGARCKIIEDVANLSERDELRLLLECNVLTYSNEKPDPRQVRDLIKIYDEEGYDEDEIIKYLSEQINYSTSTLRRSYGEALAIPELKDLAESNRLTTAAMRRLCQGKKDEELQKRCYEKIITEYADLPTIDEETANLIKRTCKDEMNGQNHESKACAVIRKINTKYFAKGVANFQKIKRKGMTDIEIELCVKEMEDHQRKIGEMISILRKSKNK